MKRIPLVLLSVGVAGLAIGGAAFYRYTHPIAAATGPATGPVVESAAATRPATVKVVAQTKGPTTQILDVLRAADPRYPTTRRLDGPLDVRYAARVVLEDPVYLDGLGNLWVTRADGPERFDFAGAVRSETACHVVRDRVAFVVWHSPDEQRRAWVPRLVVRAAGGSGYELVDRDGRRPLADPYGFQWGRALVLSGEKGGADHVVVPTASGACAFAWGQSGEQILAGHRQLFDPKLAADRAVRLVMDTAGVIAYTTNGAGTAGARGVARFAPPAVAGDGAAAAAAGEPRWTVLTGAPGWPDRLLHLVPFLDGSVLQIVSGASGGAAEAGEPEEADAVHFALTTVAASAVDDKRVKALVRQLSADEPEVRDAAYKALTTFGPGITALLEASVEFQPPEAQARIRLLLANKVIPSLGGMSLIDGRARVASRLPDGGVIFYAERGVSIPRAGEDSPDLVVPAWISIRPTRPVELLKDEVVADLNPDKHRVIPWGPQDMIVIDPVLGPRWLVGKRLEPLLRKRDRAFTEFGGIDSTGRWIFRTPVAGAAGDDGAAAAAAATAPSVTTAATTATTATTAASTTRGAATVAVARAVVSSREQRTLLIDPHLPDTTPRLPGWLLPKSAGKVGWDKDNWPVIYIAAKPDAVPWALQETGWRVIDEKVEKVFTEPGDVPVVRPPAPRAVANVAATTGATTSSSTAAGATLPSTTRAATSPVEPVLRAEEFLLEGADGLRYYGGRDALVVEGPDGAVVRWALPELAVGGPGSSPRLFRTREGLLFLVNEPGRVARIRPTPDEKAPFALDDVFSRTVPSDASPLRVWLDPADRICFAHGDRVTVLFPAGRIPPAIADQMRPEDFPAEDAEE